MNTKNNNDENRYSIKFDILKGINESDSIRLEKIIKKERRGAEGIIHVKTGKVNFTEIHDSLAKTQTKFTFNIIGNTDDVQTALKGIISDLNQLDHEYEIKDLKNKKIIFSSNP